MPTAWVAAPSATTTPPRAASPTVQPATPAPTPTIARHAFSLICDAVAYGVDSWYDRLYFHGRTYALAVPGGSRQAPGVPQPSVVPPVALGEPIGRVFAPWQVAETFANIWHAPPGAPIAPVRGAPPEAVLAVTHGGGTDLFCAVPGTDLARTRVVRGRVAPALAAPYCSLGRCLGSVPSNGVLTVEVRETWHGAALPGDAPLPVIIPVTRIGGRVATLPAAGAEVVLFLRPEDEAVDFWPPERSGAPAGQPPRWVADMACLYAVESEQLRWVGDGATLIPLADFRAGLAETFAGAATP